MNRKLLQKVIDELNKDNPKLDYIRGILETMIESLPSETINTFTGFSPPMVSGQTITQTIPSNSTVGTASDDPILAMEAGARSKLSGIQKAEIQ